MTTGTHDISTLLAATNQTVTVFGEDNVADILEADRNAHNAIVDEMVSEMTAPTTERVETYGASGDGEMQEVDEYGRAPTQKPQPGANVSFPLRLRQFNLGWTAKYLEVATPADLATSQLNAEQAHWRAIQLDLKRSIYNATNFDYRDHLIDNVILEVKRFVNADGAPIPNGPNGEVYDPDTHTHYVANNGWSASVLATWINSVIEHGHGGAVKVAINKADETAVRGLSGFVPYPDPRIIYRATDTPGTTLDISRLDNRAIGIFEGAEIWVKSWALDNYPFIWDSQDPKKPLKFRQRAQTTLQGLRTAAENKDYPLLVKFMEAEFGIGVWTRTNGLVGYTASGTFTNPTL